MSNNDLRSMAEQSRRLRGHRKATKERLLSGRLTIRELLLDPHQLEESWPVLQAIAVVPCVGPGAVARIASEMCLSNVTTVGSLTLRQRMELAARVERAATTRGRIVRSAA